MVAVKRAQLGFPCVMCGYESCAATRVFRRTCSDFFFTRSFTAVANQSSYSSADYVEYPMSMFVESRTVLLYAETCIF